MKTRSQKIARLAAKFIVAFFIVGQYIFGSNSYGGAWCKPSLFAPAEDGHYTYRFLNYGFPLPFLTIVKEDCFEAQSTAYEWSPLGVGVDGLILTLLAFPLWRDMVAKNTNPANITFL